MSVPLLRVENLEIAFPIRQGWLLPVRGVSFCINRGEAVGLVGESGSGKTLTGLACLRLVPAGAQLSAHILAFEGSDILRMSERELRSMRGGRIGLVAQDPFTSLHPSLTIGTQINDALTDHGVSRSSRAQRIIESLQRVSLPEAQRLVGRYPHELSGGMRQRAMIALALANRPSLLIADEPTTALDAMIQAQILRLLADLRAITQMSMLLISHNLGVVAGLCDRLLVMYAGRIVEAGSTAQVLGAPMHPYTRALLDAVPRLDSRQRLRGIPGAPPTPWDRPSGCPFHPRCALRVDRCSLGEPSLSPVRPGHLAACWVSQGSRSPVTVRMKSAGGSVVARDSTRTPRMVAGPPLFRMCGLTRQFRTGPAWHRQLVQAVDEINLEIRRGEALGIVGESGSGKSTLIRLLALLDRPTRGSISYDGEDLSSLGSAKALDFRRRVQIVFQDPYASLDPRYRVADSIREALVTHRICTKEKENLCIREALNKVGLSSHFAGLYPRQLSGGQRQRVCIARALAVHPEVLLADEPVSALDVSIQAQILELFEELRQKENLTLVVVAHDLALIREISDRVITLYLGKVVEDAPTKEYTGQPLHPYSFSLARSVPNPDQIGRLPPVMIATELLSALRVPSGCRFHPRCFKAAPRCSCEEPELAQVAPQHRVACFYPVTDAQAADHVRPRVATKLPRERPATTNVSQRGEK